MSFPIRRGFFGRQVGLVRAVDQVSFFLPQSSIVALVGESGSGKTTLGRAITGLNAITAGQVRLDDHLLDKRSLRRRELRRQVQMVFQDPFTSLNPRKTVKQMLSQVLRIHGVVSPRARVAECQRLLEMVGLPADSETLETYPHEFSGGQRQRLAIARSLAARPRFIVADEAVSSLDASVRAQILKLFLDLRAELHLGILFITHDLAVVRSIADITLVMYLGKIVEQGSTDAVFTRSAHPYTVALLSATPIANLTHRIGVMKAAGEIPDPASPPTGCPFHPRCPMRKEVCTTIVPPAEQMRPGHMSRCHFADQVLPVAFPEVPPQASAG